jgi:hypothetical protein
MIAAGQRARTALAAPRAVGINEEDTWLKDR